MIDYYVVAEGTFTDQFSQVQVFTHRKHMRANNIVAVREKYQEQHPKMTVVRIYIANSAQVVWGNADLKAY